MGFQIACEMCGAIVRVEEVSIAEVVRCPECASVARQRVADDENPYESPAGTVEEAVGESEGEAPAISPGARRALLGTRRWVFVVSAFGFVAVGFYSLMTGVVLVSALYFGDVYQLLATVVALVLTVYYFALSYHLARYGRRIGALRRTDRLAEFEEAVIAQNTFWRYLGIGATVWVVFVAWAFLVAPWFE